VAPQRATAQRAATEPLVPTADVPQRVREREREERERVY
jgi:hypothetical protein